MIRKFFQGESKFDSQTIFLDDYLKIKPKEVYRNLNFFEDAGECGDPWWRWTPPTDRVFNTLGLQAGIAKETDGPVMAATRENSSGKSICMSS